MKEGCITACHSTDTGGSAISASRGVPVYAQTFAGTHCAYPLRDGQAELTWVAGYIPIWFIRRRRDVSSTFSFQFR